MAAKIREFEKDASGVADRYATITDRARADARLDAPEAALNSGPHTRSGAGTAA